MRAPADLYGQKIAGTAAAPDLKLPGKPPEALTLKRQNPDLALDHAQCVPNASQGPRFAQVGALSSGVCKTAHLLATA